MIRPACSPASSACSPLSSSPMFWREGWSEGFFAGRHLSRRRRAISENRSDHAFDEGPTRALALAATLWLLPTIASAQQTVRIAQGVASLSFLPVWGARALNSFAAEGLNAPVLL